MSDKEIYSVLEKYASRLIVIEGVSGVAQGTHKGKPCIKVYVVEKNPEIMRQIPASLEGYTVLVEESGKFRALGTL